VKTIGRRLNAIACLLQRHEDSRHMLKKQLAGAGQSRAARCAGEQHGTQLLFQFFDGPRQRRLLHMQPFGCAREMEFFSYGQEAAKVP